MASRGASRAFAAIVASVAWAAVLLQGYLLIRATLNQGRTLLDGIAVFLGYFTVLTNILVCVSLSLVLTAKSSAAGRFVARADVCAGIAANIAFVALAYHLLLRASWNPQGGQWIADVLLHYAVPVLYLLYWRLISSTGSLRWTDPLSWSAYPAVYLVYALARGEIIGTYPYPFIDVAAIGYTQTLRNALGLLLAFMVLGLALVLVDRTKRLRVGYERL
jgi:hypothetical protein